MPKATLKDVAAMAGVSIKTVSRVVNKEPNVRAATRDSVLRAVDTLGYRPDASARRLAGSRSYLIGLIYEDPSPYDNPSGNYVIDLQSGVLAAVKAQGYDLLIHPCGMQAGGIAEEIVGVVEQARLDGVILAPPIAEQSNVASVLRRRDTPFVRISPGRRTRSSESVHTNDRDACADMTRYLASLGHERIGFIIGHPDHRAVGNRYLGFQDGLASCNLKINKSLVKQGFNTFESGEECARKLLLQKNRPTAIFASNDDMAAGVLRVAHEMGLGIPDDLSVAGFDDVPLARLLWPALTTIRQPTRELATTATEMLLAVVRGETCDRPPVVKSPLILRESTGPARRPQGRS